MRLSGDSGDLMAILFCFPCYRYCFVQLKPESDIEEVKKEISEIDFGTGKISVENKITRHEVAEVSTPYHLE